MSAKTVIHDVDSVDEMPNGVHARPIRKPVKLLLVNPMRWAKKPRAQQGDTRGEFNFETDEFFKGVTVFEDGHGLTLFNVPGGYTLRIPWTNISCFWFDG